MSIWGRWARYRRTQRARMDGFLARDLGFDSQTDESAYGSPPPGQDEPAQGDLLAATLPLGPGAGAAEEAASGTGSGTASETGSETRSETSWDARRDAGTSADGSPDPGSRRGRGPRRNFGPSGTPFNRQSPFYVGFVGAVGVLTAYAVVQAVGRLGTVISLLVISFFLTLSLNPLVEALTRRRVSRGWAVTIVFLGVLAVFTLVGWVVIPPVAEQGSELATNAPRMFDNLLANPWVQEVDHRYQLVQRIQEEVNRRVADGNLWAGIFGGVLDAGKLIATGVFSVLTVLVLTLYFLSSLPAVKQAAYALVPASRRPRTSPCPRRSCGGSGRTPSGRSSSPRSTRPAPGS